MMVREIELVLDCFDCTVRAARMAALEDKYEKALAELRLVTEERDMALLRVEELAR